MRTTPAGLAEEGFGGFTLLHYLAPCVKSELGGVNEPRLAAAWRTLHVSLKTPSNNLNGLNSCAALAVSSKVTEDPSSFLGETGKWTNNGQRERVSSCHVHGPRVMFCKECCCCCCTDRAVEPHNEENDSRGEGNGAPQRRAKQDACVQGSGALDLLNIWLTLSFGLLSSCYGQRFLSPHLRKQRRLSTRKCRHLCLLVALFNCAYNELCLFCHQLVSRLMTTLV